MATKNITKQCSEVNGGRCKHKVSANNGYVCAAGHGARVMASSRTVDDFLKMGWKTQKTFLATPDINVATQQALFAHIGRSEKKYLASNPSLDESVQKMFIDEADHQILCNLASNPSVVDSALHRAIFEKGSESASTGIHERLATNPSIDQQMQWDLFNTNDIMTIRNLALNPSATDPALHRAIFEKASESPLMEIEKRLATNPSIDQQMQWDLFNKFPKSLEYLASNTSLDPSIQLKLASKKAQGIQNHLARNPSTTKEAAIKLAEAYVPPWGYVRSRSVAELSQLEHLTLVDKFPVFGQAYLDVLLNFNGSGRTHERDGREDVKLLALYAYQACVKIVGANDNYLQVAKTTLLARYSGDEELKYLAESKP